MNIKKDWEFFRTDKPFIMIVAVIVFVCIFSASAFYLHEVFDTVISIASFLAWHNVFETISIMVCFSVFIVTYYTFNQTKSLRTIFVGCLLLTVGILDAFHTLSFKGMPAFFIENVSSNRATTFWIISRLICGIGFLIACHIPVKKKAKENIKLLVWVSFLTAIAVFVVATYFPGWLPPMFIEGYGLTLIKKIIEYVVIILFMAAGYEYLRDYFSTRNKLSALMCSAFILGISSEFLFTVYRTVMDSFNFTGHIYKVLMFFIILRVIYVRNVQMPYLELSVAKDELKEYAYNLDRIVEHRTRQLKVINRKLMEDLECAKDIQKAMLPSFMPETDHVAFNSGYFPTDRLSGDFYDVFRIDDQHIGLCICDVSGHGVSAAMLTVFLKQSIGTRMEMDRSTGNVSFPSTVLKNIYDSFNNSNFKEDVYMVLLYAIYNEATKKLIYSSAGLNTPPMLIESGGRVSEINISGFPICKFSDVLDVEYTDSFLELKSGDKLLFYTDGLVEAQNYDRDRYTTERLKAVLEDGITLDGKALSDKLMDNLNDFLHGNSIADDITFFTMEIK